MLAWLAVLALAPSLGQAQDEPPPEAIELYRSGRAHYDAGRYNDAIVDLKAALALDPESPNLLYNVARVSELLGKLDEAIDYYKRYVGMLSDAENDERERILATIRRLEGAREEVQAAATATPQPQAEPAVVYRDAPAPGKADALFWITGGSGLVLIAGGIVTGVLALSAANGTSGFVLGEDGSASDYQSEIDRADTLALMTDVLLVGGVAAVTGAALLYFLRTPDPEPPQATRGRLQLQLHADSRNAGMSLAGSF